MDAVKFLKERERLCKSISECSDCPMEHIDGSCIKGLFGHPDEAVEIVEKWSEEHPERIGDVE